jgi:hypothetical protein
LKIRQTTTQVNALWRARFHSTLLFL